MHAFGCSCISSSKGGGNVQPGKPTAARRTCPQTGHLRPRWGRMDVVFDFLLAFLRGMLPLKQRFETRWADARVLHHQLSRVHEHDRRRITEIRVERAGQHDARHAMRVDAAGKGKGERVLPAPGNESSDVADPQRATE